MVEITYLSPNNFRNIKEQMSSAVKIVHLFKSAFDFTYLLDKYDLPIKFS